MAVERRGGVVGGRARARDAVRFLGAFLRSPREVGAILPTSRRAVSAMLDLAPLGQARLVVELGAGTGAHTRQILERLPSDGRLVAFELDTGLAAALDEALADPRLDVVADSAANVEAHLDGAKADTVVCAVPLTALPAAVRAEILAAAGRILADDGVLVVLQYTPLLRRQLEEMFGPVERRWLPLNVPPAFAFVCRPGGRSMPGAGQS
jgi:phospholipid N-methyltransferase